MRFSFKSVVFGLFLGIVIATIVQCASPGKAVGEAQTAASSERDLGLRILNDPSTSNGLRLMAQAAVDDAAKHDAKLLELKQKIDQPAVPDQNVTNISKAVSGALPPPWDLVAGLAGGGAAAWFSARAKGKKETAEAEAERDDANRHTDQLAKGLAEAKAASPTLAAALNEPVAQVAFVGAMDKDVQETIAAKMATN